MPFQPRGSTNARSATKKMKHKGLVSKNLTLSHPWCLCKVPSPSSLFALYDPCSGQPGSIKAYSKKHYPVLQLPFSLSFCVAPALALLPLLCTRTLRSIPFAQLLSPSLSLSCSSLQLGGLLCRSDFTPLDLELES